MKIPLVLGSLFFAFFLQAKTQHFRYLNGPDIISVLAQKFPNWKTKGYDISETCRFLNYISADALGVSKPDTGAPVHDRPSPSFVRWLHKCGKIYIEADLNLDSSEEWVKRLIPLEIYEKNKLTELSKRNHWLNALWKDVSLDDKNSIVKKLITYLIGPENYLENAKVLQILETRWTSQSVLEAIRQCSLVIIMTDDFLRY